MGGRHLLLATPADSPTGRNPRATGAVRLGIGPTRDVVLVDGTVAAIEPVDLPEGLGDLFATKTGFASRQLATRYLYFRVTPRRVQAWREANEIAGRDLMRDGAWLVVDWSRTNGCRTGCFPEWATRLSCLPPRRL